jgi:hypothetical protein
VAPMDIVFAPVQYDVNHSREESFPLREGHMGSEASWTIPVRE